MSNKPIVLIRFFLATAMLLTACAAPAGQPENNASALMALDQWDLLWISDSSGWDVAEIYAGYIEEDTGIPVNVYDYWDGGLSAVTILDILEGGKNPNAKLAKLPELIPEMEVIVFYTNPDDSINEERPLDFNCGQGVFKSYVNVCDMESFAVYIQNLESIYQHIFELRGDQPTLVRAFDAYNPATASWEKDGVFEACQLCWGNYNAAIHQAASQYNVPVAQIYDAWNGPDHNEDPNDKGYTKDGVHPNELGAQVIAEELRKLGYDPVTP